RFGRGGTRGSRLVTGRAAGVFRTTLVLILLTGLPQRAYADNCSGLFDCWQNIAMAAIVAAAIAILLFFILWELLAAAAAAEALAGAAAAGQASAAEAALSNARVIETAREVWQGSTSAEQALQDLAETQDGRAKLDAAANAIQEVLDRTEVGSPDGPALTRMLQIIREILAN